MKAMVYNIVMMLVVMTLTACAAGFKLTPTEQQIGSIVLDRYVVKAVMATKDPVKTRDMVVAGLDIVESFVKGNLTNVTADAVVDKLHSSINWDKLSPEDAATLSQLLPLVKQDLLSRFGATPTAPLTAEQAQTVLDILAGMKASLAFVKPTNKVGYTADGVVLEPPRIKYYSI